MERIEPRLLLTPSSAIWISCVGVGFRSCSRTVQLPLCDSETILPAESCSPYRFRSKINECHYFKPLNFEVILYVAMDIQDNWHLLFFYSFSLLPQESVALMPEPFRQGPCQNFRSPECPCMCLPSSFPRQCGSPECSLYLPSAPSFTQCCLQSPLINQFVWSQETEVVEDLQHTATHHAKRKLLSRLKAAEFSISSFTW